MTAVEWLFDNLNITGGSDDMKAFEQAKQMEKEQIINSFDSGIENYSDCKIFDGKQYYNETYGSLGDISVAHKTIISQTEISDEEIEKFADEELGTIRTDFDFGVIQGMKWYREQLKSK